MAIGDFVAKTIVEFKADTKDLKAGLRDLQGEEKKLAEARLKQAEAHNKGIEDSIKGLGRLALAIGGAAAAWGALSKGADQYIEKVRIMAAPGNLNVHVDTLKKAAGGLKSEMDLLTFSAQAHAGAMKASGVEVEMALKAMRALEQQGHESAKVTNIVTDAVVGGEVEGFKKLGITLRETKTEAEKVAEVKRVLAELSGKVKEGTRNEADEYQAAVIRYKDAQRALAESFGKLAMAMTPVIEKLAQVFNALANFVGERTILAQAKDWLPEYAKYKKGEISKEEYEKRVGLRQVTPDVSIGTDASGRVRPVEPASSSSVAMDIAAPRVPTHVESAATGEIRRVLLSAYLAGRMTSAGGNIASGGAGSLGSAFQTTNEFGRALSNDDIYGGIIGGQRTDMLTDDWNARMAKLRGEDSGPGSGIRAAQKSQLEKMFGTVDEINAYKTAFDGITGAINAAFGAWIDGEKSAGEALAGFTKSVLKNIALQSVVKGSFEVAEAVAALAGLNPAKAAGHFASAAKYAATAALAGTIAHSIGGGGGEGGVSPGGAGGGGRTVSYDNIPQGSHDVHRTGYGTPGSPTFIITGDPFALDGARKRTAEFKRTANRAMGDNGVAFR